MYYCKKKVFFYLTSLCILSVVSNTKNYKLLIEIFRHGARRAEVKITSSSTSVANPYDDPILGVGDLTTVGMKMHYLLGKEIRNTYGDFIPAKYDREKVQIIASSYNRTIESAQSQLMGLFDLGSGSTLNYNNKAFYEPPITNFNIPSDFGDGGLPFKASLPSIHNPTAALNRLFVPDTKTCCPKFVATLGKYLLKMNEKYTPYFRPLFLMLKANKYDPKKYNGKDEFDMLGAMNACDIIVANCWSNTDFDCPSVLKEDCLTLHAFGEFAFYMTPENYKTYTTWQNKKIIDTLEHFRDYPQERKLSLLMLSAHDTNAAIFLMNFYPENGQCIINQYVRRTTSDPAIKKSIEPQACYDRIKFSSNVIIELFEKDKPEEFWISARYNNELIPIDGDKTEMSLESFLDVLRGNIDEDFEENCGAPNSENFERLHTLRNLVVGSYIVIIGLAIFLALVYSKANQSSSTPSEDPMESFRLLD